MLAKVLKRMWKDDPFENDWSPVQLWFHQISILPSSHHPHWKSRVYCSTENSVKTRSIVAEQKSLSDDLTFVHYPKNKWKDFHWANLNRETRCMLDQIDKWMSKKDLHSMEESLNEWKWNPRSPVTLTRDIVGMIISKGWSTLVRRGIACSSPFSEANSSNVDWSSEEEKQRTRNEPDWCSSRERFARDGRRSLELPIDGISLPRRDSPLNFSKDMKRHSICVQREMLFQIPRWEIWTKADRYVSTFVVVVTITYNWCFWGNKEFTCRRQVNTNWHRSTRNQCHSRSKDERCWKRRKEVNEELSSRWPRRDLQ